MVSRWQRLTDRLLEPSGVEEAGDRHTARLLAGLALCFAVLGVCSILVELALIPEFHRQAAVQGVATLLLLTAYGFARGPAWRVAGSLLSAAPVLTAFVVLYLDPLDAVAPAFMLLGVMFATFFLRFRHAAWIAGAVFALVLLLLWLRPELREPSRAIPLLVMHAIASPCLLWISAHRDRVEHIRRATLREDARRRAERERLDVIGQLASGVAHDFNNLLSVVRVNADALCEVAAPRDRPLAEELRVVADRGAALVQTLIAFARNGTLDVQQVDGNEPIARGDAAAGPPLGERNTVEPQPAPPNPSTLATPIAPVARSVLVVDDDELVRRLIQRVLELDGHRVRTAAGGADALRALEADRDTAVLVTDVSMPGMTGPQLVARARALAPKIRVLYVSALPDREQRAHDDDRVLAKPFAPQALRDAVAAL